MNRRRALAAATGLLSFSVAGCNGRTDEPAGGGSDGGNVSPSDDGPTHARSGAGVPGRIDPVGHVTGDESPLYTAAALDSDAQWGLVGSFPTSDSSVASTLVDLTALDELGVAHELDTSADGTRTNAVAFDAHREGLYYRSQEGTRNGIEVVDFGRTDGTPTEPAVVARLETPNVGVHRFVAHPDEPVLYLVDHHPESDAGVLIADVSSPDAPEIVASAGDHGGTHDLTYDPVRDVLHAAYVMGPSEGYVVYDASDPYALSELGRFEYAGQPDYTVLGEPGFEGCHQVDYDPERALVVVGDEHPTGVPGGKHVLDIGWDEGTLEEPRPVGFTHTPDAREMTTEEAQFWWTTHFHDVVVKGEETLLVDGGYRQGAWVCNLTNPREPTPTERFATVAGVDTLSPAENRLGIESPPFTWEATYDPNRDFVFVSDSLTGAYTFEVSTAEARGPDGRGPDGHYDAEAVLEDDPDVVANGEHGF